MLKKIISYFLTGQDQPLMSNDPALIRRAYERKRWSVFLSVTFGYGIYYTCRVNLGVVKDPILQEGLLNNFQMGLINSVLLVTYAVGRLTNGFLSDRCNVARFMSFALMGSAILNLLFGFTSMFVLLVALWGVNGWFQSIGSAPSVVALSHWFSHRERGTRYGIWSISHRIGEGLTFAGTAALVSVLGWRWGFFGPGLLCVATALVLSRTLADRPQTYGLPPVAQYKNDPAPVVEKKDASIGKLQLEVLRIPAIWILGLSAACIYVARYGVHSWGVLYLQYTKGYTLGQAGAVMGYLPIATGILGAVVSGFVSDRYFQARRNVPAFFFGLIEIGALLGFYMVPAGHVGLDVFLLSAFEFGLAGLVVYLGGLMAIDVVPQRAAGAAMGIIGVFSYVGAALQELVSGYLVDAAKDQVLEGGILAFRGCAHDLSSAMASGMDPISGLAGFLANSSGGHLAGLGRRMVDCQSIYSFDGVFWFWIGASVLSLLLTCMVWKRKRAGGK